uniref:Hexosyltransferase n=1 Tax=Knipowitschia caucasica TaxID=637954 RepID=A0AAV2K350_KNICA
MDSPITSVESFRFLGTTITQDLKWEPTISSLIKKAQQRMYFLWQLMKAKLPAQMLVQFYTAIIESILTSSITVWFAGGTVRAKQRLQLRALQRSHTAEDTQADTQADTLGCSSFSVKMRSTKNLSFLIFVAFAVLLLLLKDKNNPDNDTVQKRFKTTIDEKETASKMSSYVYSWPKCEPNTSAANISGFHTLPAHIQNFLFYRHCRHFPMILDIPDKCGGPGKSSDVFLFLVIKSLPGNYERREVLRKTWAQERKVNNLQIRRVFISGTSGGGEEKMRLNKLLRAENKLYSDILQWDFQDSFFNLTLKQILFLEWMERNCPKARFHFNGDDDVFVNTNNMVEYLHDLQDNDGSKHHFIGHLIENVGPIRSPVSKYYVPVQVEESNHYPPYCGGGGFILSGFTALVIYNMSLSTRLLPIDDVYMGMCLARAGLRPQAHMLVRTAGLHIPSKVDGHDPCIYRDVLLVHRFLPWHIFLMWVQINDPGLNCSSSSNISNTRWQK